MYDINDKKKSVSVFKLKMTFRHEVLLKANMTDCVILMSEKSRSELWRPFKDRIYPY